MEILGLQVVNELRQQIRAAANEAKGAGFHGGGSMSENGGTLW